MTKKSLSAVFFVAMFLCVLSVSAQTSAFTQQGQLNVGGNPASGNFDFEFKLFDAGAGGAQQGSTVQRLNVAVVNGIYAVLLDFGTAALPGANRFLDISVKPAGGGAFTQLTPRQPVTSAPYTVRSLSAATADNATQLGGVAAANYLQTNGNGSGLTNLNASSITTGTLANARLGLIPTTNIADAAVTSPKIASGQVVKSVNALTDNVTLAAGSNITITPSGNTLTIASTGSSGGILNQTTIQTGANFNIDGNGTAGGTLTGGVVNAATQYNIGGTRQFTANGPFNSGSSNFTASNSFLGERSGMNTVPDPSITDSSGKFNSFFGAGAGESNVFGRSNAYFGANAGRSASGSFNAHFGVDADVAGSGSRNVFVGYTAYSKGNDNTAVGYAAGTSSSGATQMNTTAIGSSSRITGDIQFATAIGAGSNVNTSNTVVLGRTADTVQIPGGLNITGSLDIAGSLNVTGTFTPAITNGASIVNIDAGNIATGLLSNARLGIVPIANGGTGSAIKNFVDLTTTQNIAGNKTFSGTLTGSIVNTTNQYNIDGNRVLSIAGVDNVFTGVGAGTANTGTGNSFFGRNAGAANTTGNSNTVIGSGADLGSSNLTFATAIGAGAVTNSSDTVTLGRDVDVVRVPGILRVATLGSAGATPLCQNGANAIATCSSSLRYKTNIGQFSQGMSFVNKLRPISFDWKDGGMKDVGFGAEDIAKIDPRFVTFNSAGEVEGVKYNRLSVAFVNAFKEQQSQIEEQRRQLDEQRSANTKLQAELTALRALVCATNKEAVVCKELR